MWVRQAFGLRRVGSAGLRALAGGVGERHGTGQSDADAAGHGYCPGTVPAVGRYTVATEGSYTQIFSAVRPGRALRARP